MSTLQAELQRLAGRPTLDAQGAANAYAGTSGLSIVGALNVKAGNTGTTQQRDLQGVLNQLSGTSGLGVVAAAAALSGTSSALANDNFNRADSLTSLGTATSGQAWAVAGGTWGISNNAGYPNVGADAIATLPAATDMDVSVTMASFSAGNVPGVVASFTDTSNYLRFIAISTTQVRADQYVAGAFSTNDSVRTVPTMGAGTVLRIRIQGSSWTTYVNGTQVHTLTKPALTGTRAGLFVATAGAANRFDDFSVVTPS